MKRSKRMAVVEQMVVKQEEEAGRILALAQQQLAMEEKKLADLKQHLADYENNMVLHGKQGISGQEWQSYQFFIEQLNHVISQQHRQVGLAAAQKNKVKDAWQQLHAKKQSIANFIDSIKNQEQIEQDKKDQKVMDDLVQQMLRRSQS